VRGVNVAKRLLDCLSDSRRVPPESRSIHEEYYQFWPGFRGAADKYRDIILPEYYYFISDGELRLCLRSNNYDLTELGYVMCIDPLRKGWRVMAEGEFQQSNNSAGEEI
jgi:hypothetical protein